MPMPRAPVPGWTVSMNGSFPEPDKFYINFKNNIGDIMLHVSTRLNVMNVALSVRPSGQSYSGSEYDLDPFPILANQPFMITIKAVSLFDVQYIVDGKLYINHTVPRSLGSVQSASLGDAPTVNALDLWCDA
ncbi:uncharacterized protein [Littorina saxatilis]|uniref:Galectin n=1 Tax=Littorina saxatilis TaxID=31220 RepID=A0AAN9B2C2_9CAEN